MKRLSLLLLLIGLAGCATVSENRYGYVDDPRHGGYYYDREPVRSQIYLGMGWYNPYDVMFWGLRYSYFDPFWYPGFYYGVTYFPRYYYPFGPWGSWYAGWYHPWRYHHPYSPFWGSYWDHYYAGHWHRPKPPRDPGHRPVGRFDVVDDGVPRFGSARNAAERAANAITGPGGGRGAMSAPPQRVMTRGGWQSPRGEAGSMRSMPSMPERRPMAPPARSSRPVMPSSSPGGGSRSMPAPSRGGRSVPSGPRSGRGGSDVPPAMSWSQLERPALPSAAGFRPCPARAAVRAGIGPRSCRRFWRRRAGTGVSAGDAPFCNGLSRGDRAARGRGSPLPDAVAVGYGARSQASLTGGSPDPAPTAKVGERMVNPERAVDHRLRAPVSPS